MVRNQLPAQAVKGKSFKISGGAMYTFIFTPTTAILLHRIRPYLSIENHRQKEKMKFLANAPNSMASGRTPEI